MSAPWLSARLRRTRLSSRRLDVFPLEDRVTPDVTGTVFRDNNFDGAYKPALNDQPFYAGVVVTAFNAAGASATGTTDAAGAYTIPTTALGGGRLRVELTVPAGFVDGPVGTDSDTSVRFLANGTQTGVNFGLVNPLDYGQAAPDLVVPQYSYGPTTGAAAGRQALISFPYSAASNAATGVGPAPTVLATYGQIGTTYGLAYQRDANLVFAGAFVRRFAAVGPAGPGAIYRVDRGTGNAVTTLVDLNALTAAQVPAGDTPAAFSAGTDTRSTYTAAQWRSDTNGLTLTHKIGLGDVDISADGRTLYAVNLATRELIEVPLTAAGLLDGTRTLRRTALPVSAIPDAFAQANPADVRPFALSVHDGAVFVGATYTAQTTGDRTTLRAYVFAFNPATHAFSAFDARTNQFAAGAAAPVLSADLSYARLNGVVAGLDDYDPTSTTTPPATLPGGAGTNATEPPANGNNERGRDDSWRAWDDVYGGFRNHQPLLTDIEFDRGVMVLGLRDRHGDKVSWYTSNLPDTGSGEGDLLRASRTATGPGFTLESGGVSNGVTNSIGGSGTGNPALLARGPGGASFYWGAYRYGSGIDPSDNAAHDYAFAHSFLPMGGLFQVPGGTRLATTIMDPVRYSSGGVSQFDNLTGARPQGYEIYGAGAAELGKASGLGDLEGFVDAAPLEVGNRLWLDANGDGRQTADELGIGGVVVVLQDGAGNPVPGATVTTAADGSYLFSGFAGTSSLSQRYGLSLQRGTSYRVVIPNAVGAGQQGPLNGYTLSPRQVDGAAGGVRDSDAAASGTSAVIAFTTGGTGQNDHTLDAGFVPTPDVTVAKSTSTPLVNAGEAVAFTVVVSNAGTVAANGVTLADNLPGGAGVVWGIDSTFGQPGSFVLGGAAGSQTLTLAANTNLAVGGSLSVRLVGTAGSSASPFTVTLQNTATVAVPGETNTQNNSSQASLTVQSPDVTAAKTADASPVADGSAVGFTVTVRNAGLGLATGVTLNDPLPPLGNGNLWTLDPATPANTPFRLTGPAGSQVLSLAAGTSLAAGASLSVHVLGTATAAQTSLPNTATAGAVNENNGATNNNQATATITVTVRPPDVTVAKAADAATVTAGDPVGFTVTVSNVGPNPASSVTLNDPLPALGGTNLYAIDTTFGDFGSFQLTGAAGSQVLSLNPNTTLAGNGGRLRVRVTGVSTGRPSPYTQTLTNVATVGATGDSNPNNNQATASVTVQSPDVTVAKTADAAQVTAGGQVGFTVTVRNVGLALARSVALSDLLPAIGGGNLWSVDPASPNGTAFVLSGAAGSQSLSLQPNTDLAAGGTLVVHLVGTSVSSPSPFTQSLPNSTTVSAANDGDPTNNQGQATVTVQSPDVTAQKAADAATVSAGQQVGFTVTLRNAGPGAANALTLSDPLPALGGGNLWSIDPASPNAGTFQLVTANGQQSLQLSGPTNLASGASLVVHLTGTSTASALSLANTATVGAGNENPGATGNNSGSATITVQTPDVTATKTADASPVDAGQTAGFTVVVANSGPGTALGVTLNDPLPALGGTNTWAIASDPANAFQLTTAGGVQTLSLKPNTNLAAGARLTVRVTGVAAPGLSPFTRDLPNTATVAATNEPPAATGNNASTATVTVRSPDVLATKTSDAPGVTAGQTVGFTVTVRNAGLATATGVTLSDPLPALGGTSTWAIDPLSSDAASFDLTGAAGSQALTLKPNTTLAAGAQLRVRVSGTSTAAVTTLPNTATVAATNEAPGTGNNQATSTVTVGTLSLGDRVFRDDDNNGVRGATEVGVGGVLVELLDSGGAVLRTATTDASGLYLFTGLPVGGYRVRITPPAGLVSSTGTNASASGAFEPAPGVFTSATNDTDHGTTDAGGLTVTSGLVSLTAAGNPDDAGTANRNVDFGLFPPLSLGDTVWFDLNNNGTLDSGEAGAAGVTVELFDTAGTRLAAATTNAQGGYLFTRLAPGGYRVALPAGNFQTGGPLAGFISSTGAVGSATGPSEPVAGDPANNLDHGTGQPTGQVLGPVVTLARGGAPTPLTPIPGGITDPAAPTSSYRNQDFGVFRPLSLGNLVWDDRDNNGLRDAGEPGLGGLAVTLFSGTTPLATTTTGADGGYLFTNLVPGAYTVQLAGPAGYRSSSGAFDPVNGPYEAGLAGNSPTDSSDHGVAVSGDLISGFVVRTNPVTLTAPGSNPDGDANLRQDFGLYRAFSLGNVVWLDANNDGKRQAGEAGLGGVTVRLLGASGATLGSTTTDSNGYYRFDSLPAGTYSAQVDRVSAALTGLVSSTGGVNGAGPFEPAPRPTADSTDTGTTGGGFVVSQPVTLGPGANAPTGEADLGPGGQGTVDAQADLTVDFGFFRPLSLGDQVWDDANNNGTLDAAEAGLGGLTVALLDAAGATLGTQTTTSGGYYLFTGLPAGTYTVQVTPPAGYATSTGATSGTDGRDNGTPAGNVVRSGPVVLAAGTAPTGEPATPGFTDPTPDADSNRTVDFGFFRPLSLGNLVWEDANNNGTRDAGEPGLAGLAVDLLDASGAVVASTVTSADGYYLFPGLAAGTYRVAVSAPAAYRSSSGTNGSPAGPYEPGVTGPRDNEDHGTAAGTRFLSGVVTLAAGTAPTGEPATPGLSDTAADANADYTVDFGLFRPQAVGNQVFLDANNNGVRDAGEAGVPGVAVTLLDAAGATVGTATTDPQGGYRFDNLAPGTYVVQIVPPAGLVSSTGRVGSPTGPVEPAAGNSTVNDQDHGTAGAGVVRTNPLTLGAAGSNPDEAGLANLRQDFGLFRPLSLGNLVWEDANNDGQRQAGEPGVGGAAVVLLDAAGATVGAATTDAQGGYLFTNLVPGGYTVRVTPPAGYVTSSGANGRASGPYEPGVSGTQNEEDHGTATAAGVTSAVTLTAAGTNPDGDANLRQDFGIYRPLSVGNQVWQDNNNNGKFDSGEPVLPGLVVRLLDGTGATVGTTTTDASGKYQFTLLTPGTYQVQVTPPAGFLPSTPTSPPLNATDGLNVGVAGPGGVIQSPPFTLAADAQTLDFGLLGLGSLAGQVYLDTNLNGTRDAADKPLGGVVVTLDGPSGPRTTTTDAAGRYSFTALPPGQYTIRERQPGGILLDSVDTPGSLGGTSPSNDTLAVTVGANQAGTDYNFAEVQPARVFGTVFADLNRSGGFDAGDAGIAGVPVTIAGTAYAGTPQARPLTAADVPGGLTVLTGATGRYEFPTLPPGTYQVSQGSLPPASAAVLADSTDYSGDPAVPASSVGQNVFNGVATPAGAARGPLVFAWVPSTDAAAVTDPTKRQFLSSTQGGAVATVPAPPVAAAGNQTPAFAVGTGNPSKPTYVVAGGGAGGVPLVRVLDYATGVEKFRFLAYEVGYTGGVRTATGDVTGDGVPDILTTTGLGGGPRVRVFDGVTGDVVKDFFAYEPTFTGGLFLAVGDVNGDGVGDIITGTEVGGGPRVQAFDARTGATLLNYYAFDPDQRGGVRVAAGDFNRDGRADVVATTGVGVQTRVRVLDAAGSVLTDYAPYEASYTGGVYVAAADFDGDGTPDVVVGADAGGGPRVQVFRGLTQTVLADFFAYDAGERGGVRVAAKDITGDGKAELVTAIGSPGKAGVKAFRATDLGVVESFDFTSDDRANGAYVG